MSGIVQALIGGFGAVAAAATDAYFYLTTLLLPGNGTNGAQNNTFLDSSTNNFTITRNGNTTQGTFSPFSQTGWSNYFDNSSYISFPDNAAWYFTGNYTIEFWVNVSAYPSTNTSALFAQWQDGGGNNRNVSMNMDTSGVTTFYQNFNGTNYSPTNTTLSKGVWYHIAVVLSGTSLAMWVNGTRTGTATTVSGSSNDSTYVFAIGADSGGSYKFNGYISNFRVVKGTAVYDPTQSTITVPTAPLTAITNTSLLTCQSNRFIDNSANAFSITLNGTPSVQAFSPFAPSAAYSASVVGGSGYFDGTGDYLSTSNTANLQLGTGEFTIEFWFYPTNVNSTNQRLLSTTAGSIGSTDLLVRLESTNSIRCIVGATSIDPGTPAVSANAWHHLALVRSGSGTNNCSLYLDGTRIAQGTSTSNISTGIQLIGGYYSTGPAEYFYGYISGVRVQKGTAQYSGTTLTVPTAPPTDITNTQLLLNYTNAGITDATAKNDLETVGNAQISTTQSKWGGGSMYFDGTGDQIYEPANINYDFRGGDFTIEFWMYTSMSGAAGLLAKRNDGGAANTDWLITVDAGAIKFYASDGSTYQINAIGGGTVNNSAWHHVAVTRSGSSFKVFVDGTQVGSTGTWSGSISTGKVFHIGVDDTGTGNAYYTGYLDDIRITKGYARYTANFTAPTAAFPTQ